MLVPAVYYDLAFQIPDHLLTEEEKFTGYFSYRKQIVLPFALPVGSEVNINEVDESGEYGELHVFTVSSYEHDMARSKDKPGPYIQPIQNWLDGPDL